MVTFSIIVPCYNKASYIQRTINSLREQSYAHWECILIDDGSTDHSKEVIKCLIVEEPRVRAVFKDNSGVAATRNIGLKEAKGDYIIFLDGDDFFYCEKLSQTLKKFKEEPEAEVVYSGYNFVASDTKQKILTKTKFRIKLNTSNVFLDILTHWDEDLIVPIHCCCYKREFLLKNGLNFDTSLKNKEDWDFLLQVSAHTNSFCYIEKELVGYLVVSQSRSSVLNNSMLKGTDQLFCKYYNEKDNKVCQAIAYNLRYRIVRNRLIRLLGKREPVEKLSLYSIAQRPHIKALSRQMIFLALGRSMYKLFKKI